MNTTSPGAVKVESAAKRGVIFISYRRRDSSAYVARIREVFARKFKKRDVFLDLEIGPGIDFVAAIRNALSASSVLLAIVGPDWLRPEADGHLRLSDPEDYVRLEIRAAMDQQVRVIPVLVGNSRMPAVHDLPVGLQDFANLQALELSSPHWQEDLLKLVAVIRDIVDPRFFFRRVFLTTLAVVVLIVVGVSAEQFIVGSHVENAVVIARSGRVDQGLEDLKALENRKMPGRTRARLYLYEAEIYQMKGDSFYQNDAAEKAAQMGITYHEPAVVGRAKGLACSAKLSLGLADEAATDCKQAESYSTAAKDPEGQVRAINFTANIIAKNRNPKDALPVYKQAMDIAQANGLVLDEYGALTNMGLILADSQTPSDQNQARINFDTARKGFHDKGKLGEESNLYNQFGALYLDQGKIDPARGYFRTALELAIQGKDESREAQARLNLGLISEQTGALADAEIQLVQTLHDYENLSRNNKTGQVSETGDIAEVKNNLGDIYLQQDRYEDARNAYADAELIRAKLHQGGAQAISAASLVNADFQLGKTTVAELLRRIEAAIQQATNAGDTYAQAFARVVKARVLVQTDKIAAEKEVREAIDLAGQSQADNTFAAKVVLDEILASSGHTKASLADLENLKDSADQEQDTGQSLEAQLTYLNLMKQFGEPRQQSDAEVMLVNFQKEANNKGYKLLAAKAKGILAGKN